MNSLISGGSYFIHDGKAYKSKFKMVSLNIQDRMISFSLLQCKSQLMMQEFMQEKMKETTLLTAVWLLISLPYVLNHDSWRFDG